MKRSARMIGKALPALILAVVFVASCAKQGPDQMAEGIIDSMTKGNFKAAVKDFDATMMSKMPASKLEQAWSVLTQQIGPFKSRKDTREAEEKGSRIVYITCEFERVSLDAKIAFDASDKVSGLFFIPRPSAPEAK